MQQPEAAGSNVDRYSGGPDSARQSQDWHDSSAACARDVSSGGIPPTVSLVGTGDQPSRYVYLVPVGTRIITMCQLFGEDRKLAVPSCNPVRDVPSSGGMSFKADEGSPIMFAALLCSFNARRFIFVSVSIGA